MVQKLKEQKPSTQRELVSDTTVRKEFGNISRTTLGRWDEDREKLGFPEKVLLHGRGYRWRHELEAFKAGLVQRGIRQRSGKRFG